MRQKYFYNEGGESPTLITYNSEDYKISTVKYYINNNKSLDKVCEILDCSKKSLYRWLVDVVKVWLSPLPMIMKH